MSINTTTNTMNGSFAARYASDPKRAMHHIECIRHMQKYTDAFPIEEVWKLFDDITMEEREKLIRKSNKANRKKAESFVPSIPAPKNKMNLYREDFREECRAKGVEYTDTAFRAAYKAITAEKSAELDARCKANKAKYDLDCEAEKKVAIENGDFNEPEPKKPPTAYFCFSNAVQEDIKSGKNTVLTKAQHEKLKQLKADVEAAKAAYVKTDGTKKPSVIGANAKFIAELYNGLTDAQKKPWVEMAEKASVKYQTDLYERNVRVLQRKIAKCTREGTDPTPYQTELTEVMTAGVQPVVKKSAAVATATSAHVPTPVAAESADVDKTAKPKKKAEKQEKVATGGKRGKQTAHLPEPVAEEEDC